MTTRAIERRLTTPGGTTIALEADGELVVSRPEPERQASHPALERLREALRRDDLSGAGDAARELGAALPGLDREATVDAAQALAEGLERGEREDEWSLVQKILGVICLGIPYLVDALSESDAERLIARVRAARENVGGMGLELSRLEDGDLSGNMNLVVGNPLVAATQKLAAGLGEPFAPLRDVVATREYSAGSSVDPKDFERSAGLWLVSRRSRATLSQAPAGEGFVALAWDGRPVFAGDGGRLYFDPPRATPEPVRLEGQELRLDTGGAPTLASGAALDAATARRLTQSPVAPSDVVARPRQAGEAPPRAGIRYEWRGSPLPREVGWWGMCDSSAMLGSLGVSPAPGDVRLYDEASGREVKLSADDITNLMVYVARGTLHDPMRVLRGQNNGGDAPVDEDPPHLFHAFVEQQLVAGLPFGLDVSSNGEMWNYPVRAAELLPSGPRRRTRDGAAQTFVMTLTETNGDIRRYTYELRYDARGEITGSSWDLAACERDNPGQPVPDYMWSYFEAEARSMRFSAPGEATLDTGWSKHSLTLVADLYFASHAGAGDTVCAVRRADGQLVLVEPQELEALKRGTQP